MRLQGKVCLITGAGSGIGRASAQLFASEGASVAVADIDDTGAAETVASIAAGGGTAQPFHMDVTSLESCDAAIAAVLNEYEAIDVLFNNAGIAGIGKLHLTSPELWDRVMAVNVRGVYLASRSVLPHMIERRSGSIINMSSAIADIGVPDRASYSASKGAVLALTRSMQADYAQFGIRINALLPGTIHTPFVDRYLRDSYDDPVAGLAQIQKRQLTGKLGRPEDVAQAALFLASDESTFVLGSAFFVDGGVRGAK